jgi:hypothetical protein
VGLRLASAGHDPAIDVDTGSHAYVGAAQLQRAAVGCGFMRPLLVRALN